MGGSKRIEWKNITLSVQCTYIFVSYKQHLFSQLIIVTVMVLAMHIFLTIEIVFSYLPTGIAGK